ncbi:MAG TPA: hypothetical protein VJN18_00540 [Polyangiaceae bacterium]|nr:hypothetical protein [Polyangiaceae bacterium]
MRRSDRLRAMTLGLLGSSLLGGSGCRQVLGIEGAELDPGLAQAGGLGTAAAGVDTPLNGGGGHVGGAAGVDAGDDGAGVAGAPGEPSGAGGEAGSPVQEPSLCERYCSAVTASCQGSFAVYTSYEACLSVCAVLPAGEPQDRNVNSVECRLHAASIASSEVPHYCPIAGPGGNGECGANCEAYCGLMGRVCFDWVAIDQAKCLRDCPKLPDRGSFTTDVAGQDYTGNHVQCRLYHVSAALSDDAEQHCLHAGGAAPCE